MNDPAGRFCVACIQLTSSRDIPPNLRIIRDRMVQARDLGASFILLPENAAMLEPDTARLKDKAEPEASHTALHALAGFAKDVNVWLLIGSLAVQVEEGWVANRSYLVNAEGRVVARYDKIHLFDVTLGGSESYQESATMRPGDRAVVAETPWGVLGMSVCYDLRFPQLYRALALRGANFLSIPAAFTRTTGEAHWHVLQRARAIENGCYVFAPAQCGVHAEGRKTYGHSLIIDPWGRIVAEAGDEEAIITAWIDPAEVQRVRKRIPSLHHDRTFT